MSRRGQNGVAFSLFAFQDIITSVTGIMILVTLILALELVQQMESSPSQRTKEVVQDINAAVTSVTELDAAVARNQARIAELQDRLTQGASRIGDVAGFDQRAVQQDVSDMEQMDDRLAKELQELAAQVEQTTHQQKKLNEERDQKVDPEAVQKKLDDLKKKKEDLEKLKSSNRIIFNPTEGDAKVPWLVEITGTSISVAKTGVTAPPTIHATGAAFAAWAQQLDKSRDYFVLLVKPDGIENYELVRASITRMGFDVGFDLLNSDQNAIDPEKGAAAE
ncbi:MAG: hypothetical protein H6822_30330 [Planctomycetaceae bacterium]|nr:hypothetical protein [Planctomycetales bacterium]MCB9926481.1 hypothetical protein [Planctomycetaceae bacterium]